MCVGTAAGVQALPQELASSAGVAARFHAGAPQWENCSRFALEVLINWSSKGCSLPLGPPRLARAGTEDFQASASSLGKA